MFLRTVCEWNLINWRVDWSPWSRKGRFLRASGERGRVGCQGEREPRDTGSEWCVHGSPTASLPHWRIGRVRQFSVSPHVAPPDSGYESTAAPTPPRSDRRLRSLRDFRGALRKGRW